MISLRPLFALFFLTSAAAVAQAKVRPRTPTTAQTEARNEAAAPSFASQLREARRIAVFLGDALLLSNTQWHAVECCTVAERKALALAATDADAREAQRQYLLAVRRVVAASQMDTYLALRRQLAGTLLPLDGPELAVR